MTATTTEIVETKVCKGCAEAWPITEFRLRRRGGKERMNLCRICHNDRERERRQEKELELRLSVGKSFVRALLRGEGNFLDLFTSYVPQLGSGKKLAEGIMDYLDVAPQRVKFRYTMWLLKYLQKREKRGKRR
jgi:hypothetical protein